VKLEEQEKVKKVILVDTGPLITLCAFAVHGKTIIDYILPHCEIVLVDSVATEATANPTYKDSIVISQLLKSRQIRRLPSPTPSESIIINAYTKLGQGERDTIKLATMRPFAEVIFDDYLALVIALRFGLKPVLLLDFVVMLVQKDFIDKTLGLAIVDHIAPRYSAPFVEHTRHKLRAI